MCIWRSTRSRRSTAPPVVGRGRTPRRRLHQTRRRQPGFRHSDAGRPTDAEPDVRATALPPEARPARAGRAAPPPAPRHLSVLPGLRSRKLAPAVEAGAWPTKGQRIDRTPDARLVLRRGAATAPSASNPGNRRPKSAVSSDPSKVDKATTGTGVPITWGTVRHVGQDRSGIVISPFQARPHAVRHLTRSAPRPKSHAATAIPHAIAAGTPPPTFHFDASAFTPTIHQRHLRRGAAGTTNLTAVRSGTRT